MRDHYLKNEWQSYPSAWPQVLARGRFMEFRENCLILWQKGQILSFESEKWTLHNTALPPQEVLKEGDLIEIAADGQSLQLLAPALIPWKKPVVATYELQRWSLFLQVVKKYFQQQEFLEVATPTLVTCPGSEPTLDPIAVSFPAQKEPLYLPTSPEWHLKKALARGYERIFEVRSCFRAGEVSPRHRPEFWMLEWYRSYSPLIEIQQDIEALIQALHAQMGGQKPRRVYSKTIAELFREYLHFDFTPQTKESQLRELAAQLGVDLTPAQNIDDCFFLIFMEKIESQLPEEDLIFVNKYPPYQAALARLDEQGWGERFEAYWQGFELANAFYELNDPHIQRQRFAEDMAKKTQLGKAVVPSDEDFFAALEMGLPPSSGVALGLERLYMALFSIKDIQQLRVF
ncbi:MAG: EF-P lysine aminoacylase EpmA [Bdellovibrionia bacterium]